MQTYWLYYNGQPLTAVRLPEGSTDKQVKDKTKSLADMLCDRPHETPYDRECKIHCSEVRIHERG
jgi:hypothetical protein